MEAVETPCVDQTGFDGGIDLYHVQRRNVELR